MIDGLAASLALTFLWNGWHTGSVYQIGQTVTIFMAALVARAVTLPLARFLGDVYGTDSPDRLIGVAFLGAFFVLYLILWVSVIRLTEEMRNYHERGPGDRFLGAGVGAIRGGLMGIVMAIGLLTLNFDRHSDAVSPSVATSKVSQFALRYDFLSPFADKLDEEYQIRAEQDEPEDRAWDVPR